ncbi:MAG TPA: hypothetical protein VE088_06350 [Gaiellaceae bacterium]|jgi:hypothetical protein|nr:hypothetical protein [Gaiellaceae bacterium]
MESTFAPGTNQRWLVDVGMRPDAAAPLRDYYLRLGLSARLAAPGVVELTTDEDEPALQEYTRNWERVNGVAAGLRRSDPAEAPGLLPVALAPTPRLGEVLRRKGLITEQQLEAGLNESHARGELLGIALLRMGVIFEEELARTLSEQLKLPYVSVGRVGVDAAAARMLPASVGLRLAAIPVRFKQNAVQVAFADPTDSTALDGVRGYVPQLLVAVAELSEIRAAWREVAPAA